MAIYLSMQRVRFSSPDAYEKFKVVFADTRHHLMQLPGFIHLTWWEHPDDPGVVQRMQPLGKQGGAARLAHDDLPQVRKGMGGERRDHGGHH